LTIDQEMDLEIALVVYVPRNEIDVAISTTTNIEVELS